MISGDRALSPVETMRAIGVTPSSAALTSDMIDQCRCAVVQTHSSCRQ